MPFDKRPGSPKPEGKTVNPGSGTENPPVRAKGIQDKEQAVFTADSTRQLPYIETAAQPSGQDTKKTAVSSPKPVKKKKDKPPKKEKKDKLKSGTFSEFSVGFVIRHIGNFFYLLGFYAVMYIVRTGRFLRDAGIFLGQIFKWLFGSLFGSLGTLLKGIGRDIIAPFKQLRDGVRNMRTIAKEEKKKGSDKVSQTIVSYFKRGVKSYAYLLFNFGRWLLPIGAAVILLVTIQSIFDTRYALAVEVNGSLIGYVTDENVLEDAQNILRMKIRLGKDQSLDEWQFSPVVTLATTTEISNKTQIADQILENSGNEIQEATGIYIDDELIGATLEGEELRTFLADKLAEYEEPENPNVVVSFAREVSVPEGEEVFLADSVRSFEELEEILSSNVSDEYRYTAAGDETLADIAHRSGITLNDLFLRNPDIEDEEEDFVPDEGTSFLIRPARAYLQVQKAVREVRTEEIPYEEQEELTDTKVYGFRYVTQKGENGEQTVPYDLIYVDGELVSEVRLEEEIEVLKEPVDEITQVGTRKMETIGSGGVSGFFVFPVPNATYSSRGFLGAAHAAMDINAPTGTPIYAADGGTVVVAGTHWSYGNYVEIQHPNGLKTLYAHCSTLQVSVGDAVGQGQQIATVGSTGVSTGPHLHFEVVENGVRVNPAAYVATPW